MKFNLLNIDGGKSETIDISDKIMPQLGGS